MNSKAEMYSNFFAHSARAIPYLLSQFGVSAAFSESPPLFFFPFGAFSPFLGGQQDRRCDVTVSCVTLFPPLNSLIQCGGRHFPSQNPGGRELQLDYKLFPSTLHFPTKGSTKSANSVLDSCRCILPRTTNSPPPLPSQ